MFNRIICIIAAFALLGGGVQTYRLECYRSELELYRTELTNAREQQQSIEITVDSIKSSVERTGEILGESISTIKDLRRQMQEVRKEYESMASLLYNYSSSSNLSSSGENSEEVEYE